MYKNKFKEKLVYEVWTALSVMKTWNRKCRQMRQLTIFSNPSFWVLYKMYFGFTVALLVSIFPFLHFCRVSVADPCPVMYMIEWKVFFLSFNNGCHSVLWWKLNWKCWNYRQIVQCWLLVFWTLNGSITRQVLMSIFNTLIMPSELGAERLQQLHRGELVWSAW